MFTFFGANEIRNANCMPTFKVEGLVYHLAGSLLPENPNEPIFLRIYFRSVLCTKFWSLWSVYHDPQSTMAGYSIIFIFITTRNRSHDIISRVFNLKVKKFIDLIDKEEIFGEVRCYMYTVARKRLAPRLSINLAPNESGA